MSEQSENGINRRDFAAKAGVGAVCACYGAAFGYPIYRYLASPAKNYDQPLPNEVVLTKEDIPKPGEVYRFRFGYRPAMLIHHEDGSLVCFDAVCTHLGCTVDFQAAEKRIHCACHGGVYDMNTGKNVAGPPPKPLTQYQVEVTDEQVLIKRA